MYIPEMGGDYVAQSLPRELFQYIPKGRSLANLLTIQKVVLAVKELLLVIAQLKHMATGFCKLVPLR